jgi:hypothetical protein
VERARGWWGGRARNQHDASGLSLGNAVRISGRYYQAIGIPAPFNGWHREAGCLRKRGATISLTTAHWNDFAAFHRHASTDDDLQDSNPNKDREKSKTCRMTSEVVVFKRCAMPAVQPEAIVLQQF